MLLLRTNREKRSPLPVGIRPSSGEPRGLPPWCLCPKRPPLAVVATNLVRDEIRLVFERPAAADEVAEVDMRTTAQRGLLDDAQDIPSAQRSAALVRVIETINRREGIRHNIDVAHRDQSVI